jgi:hypothetical protein
MERREKDPRTDIEMEKERSRAAMEAESDLQRSRAAAGTPRGTGPSIEAESRKSSAEIERDLSRTRGELEETIEAIERKFSPGEMLDQALRSLGGGPREFAHNLSRELKTKPLPAALTGIGLAWLMASSGRQPQPYPLETAFGPETTGEEWETAVKGRYEQAREKVGSVAGRVRGSLGRFSRSFESRGQAAGEQFGELREKAGGTVDVYGEQARRQLSRGEGIIEEQPLVLAALGFALGAVLGASLPTSEAEERLVGETGEELFAEAREFGEEQLAKGEKIAAKAGEAVREEETKETEPAI